MNHGHVEVVALLRFAAIEEDLEMTIGTPGAHESFDT
jgi:hypothetical protein